jgi:hypothetical protein
LAFDVTANCAGRIENASGAQTVTAGEQLPAPQTNCTRTSR